MHLDELTYIFPSGLIQAWWRCGLIKCLNSTFLQDMLTRALLCFFWQKLHVTYAEKEKSDSFVALMGPRHMNILSAEFLLCEICGFSEVWLSHRWSAGLRCVHFKDQRILFSYSSIHSVTLCVLWMMTHSSWKTPLLSGEDYFSLKDKVTTLLLLTFWSKIKVSNASYSVFLIPVTEHYGIEAQFCQLKKEGWKLSLTEKILLW